MNCTAICRKHSEQELVLSIDGLYRFLHDRVQEAAYALIQEAQRPAAHLRIREAAGGTHPR